MSIILLAEVGKLKKDIGTYVRKDEVQRAFLFTMGASSGALLEDWLQDSGNLAAFNALCDDGGLMYSVAASSTAMNAVAASTTARTAINNSSTAFAVVSTLNMAIGKFAAGSAALDPTLYADIDAVAASSTAMNAVAASSTAMNAVAASNVAMDAVAASQIAQDALYSSSLVSEVNFNHGATLTTSYVTIPMPINVLVVGLRSTMGIALPAGAELSINDSTYGQTERVFNVANHAPPSRVSNFPIMLMQGVKQMKASSSLGDRGWVFRFIEVNL